MNRWNYRQVVEGGDGVCAVAALDLKPAGTGWTEALESSYAKSSESLRSSPHSRRGRAQSWLMVPMHLNMKSQLPIDISTPRMGERLPILSLLTMMAFGFLATEIASAKPPLERYRQGSVNGISYEVAGKGEALVLIHGGQMDRRMWDAQFAVFAKEYRVIRYDIRGFGRSKAPDQPYSHVQDLHALLRHLRVSKAHCMGLSLGAAIAADFALVHPEMVNSLVLVCPGLGGFRFQDKANDLRAVVEAARDGNDEKAAELWLGNPYLSVAMEHLSLRPQLSQLARDNVRCWLNNPLLVRPTIPPAAERLREIRVPALVIEGERDVSDIHEIVKRMAAEIPVVEQHLVPGAGHLVPMETPDVFNRLAREFLAQHRFKR
jgi:3-oxoadipate enol-lactonase